MKTLLIALSLMVTMVACNKDAKTEYNEQRQEANKEYREDMKDVRENAQEATQERNEEIHDAKKDLREEQTEE